MNVRTVGERTDIWITDGCSQRRTDGEDQHTLAINMDDGVGEDRGGSGITSGGDGMVSDVW